MLKGNDDASLAARAIQFFSPGIPQVYYVGLLAGENDFNAPEKFGDGREINRHNYTMEEILKSPQKNVVKIFLNLIRFRNKHPAFNGRFTVLGSGEESVYMERTQKGAFCRLNVNLQTYTSNVTYSDDNGSVNSFYI